METLQQLIPQNFQTLTSWLVDFHAKHSALLEQGKDLTKLEELSFLKSQGFSETKDPDILYLKTLKVYYLMTVEKLSRKYLGFSPTWGMSLNGRYLTAKILESHKIEKGSLLSEVILGAKRTPLKFLTRNQRNIHGDYSFTIDSMNTGGVEINGVKRKLTPEECELLQGFPVKYTEGISTSQRYKCLGNAVTVNVVKYIFDNLNL